LILTLLIQRINVVKSNVIRLTYLFPDLHRECCCFPTFKDLLAIRFASLAMTSHPFLWECKVTGRIILNQNYLKVFS